MTAQSYENIRIERRGRVHFIELNRPPLNILDKAMIVDIITALDHVVRDPEVSVIAFRSAGEKAFSAGVSIQDHLPDRIFDVVRRFNDIFRILARCDKVTLAVVRGHCLGGGMELAMMCDLIVAGENARFGQPEIKLGQFPPVGVVLLPHLIGYRKAAELLLTGKTITAREAEALGLVNRIAPPEGVSICAEQLLDEMGVLSGSSLSLTKSLLRRISGRDFERALQESEEFFFRTLLATEDAKEGILAFVEKRAPRWVHQ